MVNNVCQWNILLLIELHKLRVTKRKKYLPAMKLWKKNNDLNFFFYFWHLILFLLFLTANFLTVIIENVMISSWQKASRDKKRPRDKTWRVLLAAFIQLWHWRWKRWWISVHLLRYAHGWLCAAAKSRACHVWNVCACVCFHSRISYRTRFSVNQFSCDSYRLISSAIICIRYETNDILYRR